MIYEFAFTVALLIVSRTTQVTRPGSQFSFANAEQEKAHDRLQLQSYWRLVMVFAKGNENLDQDDACSFEISFKTG